MQQNTVILSLDNYNELRDIKEKVIEDHIVLTYDDRYSFRIFNYSNVEDVIKELVKINEGSKNDYFNKIEELNKSHSLEIMKLNDEIELIRKENKLLKLDNGSLVNKLNDTLISNQKTIKPVEKSNKSFFNRMFN